VIYNEHCRPRIKLVSDYRLELRLDWNSTNQKKESQSQVYFVQVNFNLIGQNLIQTQSQTVV